MCTSKMRPSTVALFVTTAMRIEGLCSRKLRAAFAASFRKWLSVFCPVSYTHLTLPTT